MIKFDWNSFFTNILAVVLGIFITFWIQGIIDRKQERKEVMSALELVKEELINNTDNLKDVINIINSERSSAQSLQGYIGNIDQCSVDSLVVWNAYLGNEYFFTVTNDALELLKSSSLFQKINDKSLALGIIKAYDYLEADSKAFNTHEEYKISIFMDANTEKMKNASLVSDGPDFLRAFYSTPEAQYCLKSIIELSEDSFLSSSVPEIEATIASLTSRMK